MPTADTTPRRKRRPWLLLVAVLLLTVLGLGLAVPGSPIYLAKLLEPEPKVEGRTRSELVAALASEDKQVRAKAVEDLGKMNTAGRKALPELVRVLRTDSEGEVRASAADAASKMYPANESDAARAEYAATVLEAFTNGLTDSDLRVRHNSAIGLLKLKAQARPAVPTLLQTTKDSENDTNLKMFHTTVRQVMLRALGEAAAGTPDGVPTFTAMLDEKVESPQVQGRGQRPMGPGAKEVEEVSRRYIQATINRRIAVAGLGLAGEHGRASAPKIRELLKSTDTDDQFEAKQALERMGVPVEGG